MVYIGMIELDIFVVENNYIFWEGQLKYYESILWKKMIGLFGGCYVLRFDFFVFVFDNFLVDDFYIILEVFEWGGLVIKEFKVICYEFVGYEL